MPLAPTPWLNPPDYVGSYLRGAQIGASAQEARNRLAQQAVEQNARIGLEQQRLQQQAAQQQAELEMHQQLAQQKALQDQQQLEITKQYHLAQVGLQQQKLEETKAMNAMKVQKAAQAASAMMEYENRAKAGEDRGQLMMELGPRMAASGIPIGGMGSVMRAQQATVPKELEIKQMGKESFYRSSPTERYQHVPSGSEDRFMENKEVTVSMARISSLQGEIDKSPDMPKRAKDLMVKSLDEEKRKVNAIYKNRGKRIPFPEVEGEEDVTAPKKRFTFNPKTGEYKLKE